MELLKDYLLQAWQNEDKVTFSSLLFEALRKGMEKEDILKHLEINSSCRYPNEEFTEWAYLFIVTEGQSDCAPG